MQTFVDFLVNYSVFIFLGGYLGFLYGKIYSINKNLEWWSSFDFKWLQKDVERLKDAKYDLIKREEMILHTHALFQRVSMLEARLEERKNAGK